MNSSKAGSKLDPALKALIDPVYEHDKTRYARICQWVWTCQKAGWPDEAIGKAIQLAGPALHTVDNWFAYLTHLLPKASGRANEDQSEKYKREEKNFIDALLGSIKIVPETQELRTKKGIEENQSTQKEKKEKKKKVWESQRTLF